MKPMNRSASKQAKEQVPAARARRRGKRLSVWRVALLVCLGGMTATGAAAIGIFMAYVRTLPPIEVLEYYEPAEVTLVSDRSGQLTIGEIKKERRYVTPIGQIPKRLQEAFLAIEDARFYDHFGLDIIGVLRALFVKFQKPDSAMQGASTITQQLTRNVLKEVGTERSLERKIKEAIFSLQIERRYSKDQILEFYLNHIEFIYNSFGVRAAASTYFSKDLDELTIAECATLAAMPKNPVLYNPKDHPERTTERRNLVLQRMLEVGYIGKETYEQAIGEPLVTVEGKGAPSLYPHFLDAMQKTLERQYGLTAEQLKLGGLRITSTLDPAIQDACTNALREGLIRAERLWQQTKPARRVEESKEWDGVVRAGGTYLFEIVGIEANTTVTVRLNGYSGRIGLPEKLPYHEPADILKPGKLIDVRVDEVSRGRVLGTLADIKPVSGAVVVLDAHTGEVLGLTSGESIYSLKSGGWNAAIQGGRQPGSCLKPFFYAAAMQRRFQPNDLIVDEPVEYGPYERPYRPINYEKSFTGSPMTLVEALEHSRNVVTIRLFEGLGIKKTLEFVRHFDFTNERARWTLPAEISTCLGTIDSTPMEMAAAYQVFANLGVAVRPQYIRSMLKKNGEPAHPVRHWEEPLLDPVAAYQTLYMLRQVVVDGTGKLEIGEKFPRPQYPEIAGKTGTTNDCRDAWFCGMTPDLVIVAQVGFDPPRPMGPKMTGGRVAGPIWAAAFREIYKTRDYWQMEFEAPGGVDFANICGVTGKRSGGVCGSAGHKVFRRVPFRQGEAPTKECNHGANPLMVAPVSAGYSYEAANAAIKGFARPLSPGAKEYPIMYRHSPDESPLYEEVPEGFAAVPEVQLY